MLSKNHPVILFIDRFGFSVYQDILTNIPKFNFTPDLVSNMDVVNKEQFASLIATFIQINKMTPSSLAVILSDSVIYVKDLVDLAQKPPPTQGLSLDLDNDKEYKDEVQNFLADIPFEEVMAKVIKTGSINRIVAVNKTLVMAIIDAFASKGFGIEAITPGFMYGQSANFTAGLTSDNIRIILENTETLRLGNLLTDQERMIPSQAFGSEPKASLTNGMKKPRNMTQYILVGVFAILLVILAVVYFTMGVSKTPPVKRINNPANAVVVPTVALTSVQESITTIPADLKTINVKISHDASSSVVAANLKSILSEIGFQNVFEEVSELSTPGKSSIIFSSSIPVDLRNNMIVEIKKILPDISILESQDSNFTINILVGES